MRSSGVSRRSELIAVWACLTILAAASVLFFAANGYLLYYGDAQAHLNLSRSIIDSRTPGYEQVGTVWLPVLHVICLPLVGYNALWSSGLAGSIPVALCFIVAGVFLYLAAVEVYSTRLAPVIVLACFALNPNVLYLASIPMTEIVFLAEFACLLFCFVRFRTNNRMRYIAVAIVASWLMSLTRYDGWFLIPFEALWFAAVAKRRRFALFLLFAAIASAAPLYWIAHNWYWTGNAFDFFNGPYSAKAIQGNHPYPGLHNWPVAVLYYSAAAELCSGWGLVCIGIVGLVFAWLNKNNRWPALLLTLTPLFYIWSIHSSGNPIHVPTLYPFSYYNTRYGIVTVMLFAFCAGAIVDRIPTSARKWPLVIPFVAIVPWIIHPSPGNWICWKESLVNSVARRAWTAQAAAYFREHYRSGEGILSGFGDLTGIYCRARIPIRETLHIGNGPQWYATTIRPHLSHPTAWAVAPKGDALFDDLIHSGIYTPVFDISVPGAPALEIFGRNLAFSKQ